MDQRLDILYVITDLEIGGVPLHLRRLVGAMRGRGFRCAVVSLAPAGPVGEMMREDGVEVYDCGACCRFDVRVMGRLAAIVREHRSGVVHSLLFHANLASRFAARMADFPADRVVCEIQTVEVERTWHLWVDRFTHVDCRFTIGNSPSVVEHLCERARIPMSRLRLVKGGIDPSRIRSAAPFDLTSLGIPAGALTALWVGRLDPVKGLGVLLDAFARVRAAVDAHLLLAGDGPLREQLEGDLLARGLNASVHFLGSRNDVPSLLKSVDAFVFPSRTEGLPNALLEAMAAGKAIVTTDVPGCRDLIRDGVNGLVVPYGNAVALAGAIRAALTDRSLSRRLGERASRDVDDRWHIDATFDAYASIYREVMA